MNKRFGSLTCGLLATAALTSLAAKAAFDPDFSRLEFGPTQDHPRSKRNAQAGPPKRGKSGKIKRW